MVFIILFVFSFICATVDLFLQLLQEAAFGEATPLGSSIYAPNLKKLAVADVLQYRASHFVQSNVVVAGNGIAQDRLDAAINKWAPSIAVGAAHMQPATAFVGGEVKVRTDMDGASRFGLAFHVPAGDAGESCLNFKNCLFNAYYRYFYLQFLKHKT